MYKNPVLLYQTIKSVLRLACTLPIIALTLFTHATLATPPFSGTVFIDPDLITPADPSAFTSLDYTGRGNRTVFDRRTDSFVLINAYLFNAAFNDKLSTEIQVNPEFGNVATAAANAQKYAITIGKIPFVLRQDMSTVTIHKGVYPFGGGNNNMLIHTGQAALYQTDGFLEEVFIHEAAHTSLDASHERSTGWIAAQKQDAVFISDYAQDNPFREDIAESFLPYLAVTARRSRISQSLNDTVRQTIPERIRYFESQNFNLAPLVQPPDTSPGGGPSLSVTTPAILLLLDTQ